MYRLCLEIVIHLLEKKAGLVTDHAFDHVADHVTGHVAEHVADHVADHHRWAPLF